MAVTELINERAIVAGLAYRSAAPYGLDAEAVGAVLGRLGVGAVADLRSPQEQRLVPWQGLSGDGVRLLDVGIDASKDSNAFELQTAQDLGDMYLSWLDLKRETIARALVPLAGGTPTLFQCSAGKDRTGVLAALVHLLAGHEHDLIVEDYAATTANMPAVKAAMLSAYASVVPTEALVRLEAANAPLIMQAPEDAMRTFIRGVEEEYGGVGGFLRSTHMSTGEMQAIRETVREAAEAAEA